MPAAWVDRLFERFMAMYGTQKVVAMWAGCELAGVKATWAEALGRYESATLADAVRALLDSGSAWPPTLPEFVEQCRQAAIARREYGTALPPPAATETSREEAAELLRAIGAAGITAPKARDRFAWAHRIVERYQAGDTTLKGCAHDMALRASEGRR